MNETETEMAQQVAQVAMTYQKERTGHAPAAVTVILSEDTLVVTMHDALTPAEKALALSYRLERASTSKSSATFARCCFVSPLVMACFTFPVCRSCR